MYLRQPDLEGFVGEGSWLYQYPENAKVAGAEFAARHDLPRQTITCQHILLTSGGGVELYPVKLRYAWPSELDLMAKLAGMNLKECWSSWKKEPFDGERENHISLYTLFEE